MIEAGFDDHTAMAISGHSSTRMLERYTHSREEWMLAALDLPWMVTNRSQDTDAAEGEPSTAPEIAKLLGKVGGRQEDRTPDLRIANAALSQLS